MGLRDKPRYQWFIVLGSVIAVYLLINLALPSLFGGFTRVHVVQPILWCLLAGVVLLASRYGTGGKLRFTKSLLLIGLLLGAFQLACMVIAGLLGSFGNSPYSHTPYWLFLNIVFFGTALVGIEFSRAYLLSAFSGRYPVLMMGLIAVFFTLVMIPTTRYTSTEQAFPYFGGTCLPLMAENLLACLLALMGGPVAAIAYRGALEAFEWFSPILPDLDWMVAAFVGTLAPVLSFLVLESLHGEPGPKETKAGTKKRSSTTGWVVTAIVAVVLMWVSFGLLGFHPVVIVSGSMTPVMDVGDIAILREATIEDIHVGDVIEYGNGGGSTIHRVVEVLGDGGSVTLITKGDANDSPDVRPVQPNEIRGRVIFSVPKLGWVSLKVKSFLNQIF